MSHRGKLLEIKAAAEYSGLTVSHLRQAVARRTIAFVRINAAQARIGSAEPTRSRGRLGFCERDLDDYIDRHRVDVKPTPAKAELPSRVSASNDAEPIE